MFRRRLWVDLENNEWKWNRKPLNVDSKFSFKNYFKLFIQVRQCKDVVEATTNAFARSRPSSELSLNSNPKTSKSLTKNFFAYWALLIWPHPVNWALNRATCELKWRTRCVCHDVDQTANLRRWRMNLNWWWQMGFYLINIGATSSWFLTKQTNKMSIEVFFGLRSKVCSSSFQVASVWWWWWWKLENNCNTLVQTHVWFNQMVFPPE